MCQILKPRDHPHINQGRTPVSRAGPCAWLSAQSTPLCVWLDSGCGPATLSGCAVVARPAGGREAGGWVAAALSRPDGVEMRADVATGGRRAVRSAVSSAWR